MVILSGNICRGCRIMGIAAIILLVWSVCVESAITQQTATVRNVRGDVFGIASERGRFPAKVGTVLQGGDGIETLIKSSAGLRLSEGSEALVGENTRITITTLVLEQVTKARRTRVKLLQGRMRATLLAGHQEAGSSFTIETPNALADVKFSNPVIEVSYDPLTGTTTIDAYTVDVIVTDLNTMKIEQLRKGGQAIIRPEGISMTSTLNQQAFETQKTTGSSIGTDSMQQLRIGASQATSTTVPSSGVTTGSGSAAETSNNPSPGVRPERPHRVVIFHFDEQ